MAKSAPVTSTTEVPVLRDYQVAGIEKARNSYRAGNSNVLLVGPTGSGKTTIFCYIIWRAQQKNRKTCVIAHRTELIEQCSERLDSFGIDHGIIQGSHPRYKPWLPVQVASIATLARRKHLKGFDFIVVDEAHHARAPTYMEFIKANEAQVLGCTATPYRGDGKGLGAMFTDMVIIAGVQELVEQGWLVPPRMYAPSEPDLLGIRTIAGDYDKEELAERCDIADLIGDIVLHWKKLALGRPTVCFAVNILHSQHITAQFVLAGVNAVHLDGTTPADERADILERLRQGRIEVVCNVGVMQEGTDVPCLGAIILARPTKSHCLYVQMVGRGLRPYEDLEDCVVLDHGGNCLRHGDVRDEVDVDLSDGLKKKKVGPDSIGLTQCAECYRIYDSSLTECPECGAVKRKLSPAELAHLDGELKEKKWDPEKALAKRARKFEQSQCTTVAELTQLGKDRGYKNPAGWAWYVMKARRSGGENRVL